AAALLLNPALILAVSVVGNVLLAPRVYRERSRWRWTTACIVAAAAGCCGVVFRAISQTGLSAGSGGDSNLRLALALTTTITVALLAHEGFWALALRVLSPGSQR